MFKSIQATMYSSIDEGKLNYLQSLGQTFDVMWVNVGLYFVPYVNTGVAFNEDLKAKMLAYAAQYLKDMELESLFAWDFKIVGKIYKSTTYDFILTNAVGMKIIFCNVSVNREGNMSHASLLLQQKK